jgi:hypothetical protein
MTGEQRLWLGGQIEAIRRLNEIVSKTVGIHCRPAAEELRQIEYACNKATLALRESAVEPAHAMEER